MPESHIEVHAQKTDTPRTEGILTSYTFPTDIELKDGDTLTLTYTHKEGSIWLHDLQLILIKSAK